MKKKALVYSPYLDSLGGGERYAMGVARTLADLGYEVEVAWDNKKILGKLARRFGVDVAELTIIPNFLARGGSWGRWRRTGQYGVVFFISDGSVPLLFSRKNLLHFQIPFHDVGGRSLFNRLKLVRMSAVVCNSEFTRKVIEKEYGVKGVVIYPPVAVEEFEPMRKKKMILSVGRFSQLKQAKRQDVLVEVFCRMVEEGLSGWKLVLAGGVGVGTDKKWFRQLKEEAKGYPIEIKENPDFGQLKKLYGTARIFWSAAGFEVDEASEPERVEHFGIAVVEAMAAGAVPVVYWAGGHREIVRRGKSGEGWGSEEELRAKSLKLVEDEKYWGLLSRVAQKDAQKYSFPRFADEISALVA